MIETTVGVAIAFAILMFGLGVMVALKAGATAASWREQELRGLLSIERMRPHTHDADTCPGCSGLAILAVKRAYVTATPVRQTAVLHYPALVRLGGGAEGWAESARGEPPRSMDDFHRDLDGGPPRR